MTASERGWNPIGRAFDDERSDPDPERWRGGIERLRDHTVVFVGVADRIFTLHSQFAAFENILIEENVELARAESWFFETYEVNGPALAAQFRAIHEDHGGKPLVVLTNPQTGPDSLYAALGDPSLLTDDIVARLVLIQPAFGTPLVDLPASAFEAWPEARAVVDWMFGAVIDKFSADRTMRRFHAAIAGASPATRRRLDERLVYVRSYSGTLIDTNPIFWQTFLLLRALYGLNDGVTPTEHQKLDAVGRDLGVVQADHWDLYASLPAANSLPGYRRAFLRALVPLLFDSRAESR